MREAGVIAAAGIVALESMVDRLAEDHANAKLLAEGLAELPGLEVDPEAVQTNLVFVGVVAPMGPAGFVDGLREHGVRCMATYGNRVRLVTHYGIERADIEHALRAARQVLGSVPVGAR
jgi:threonine aldolase